MAKQTIKTTGWLTLTGIDNNKFNIPIYTNTNSSNYSTGTWFPTKPDSESVDDVFNRKRLIRTKDSELIELTYAEIYELKRLKKIPEEMTKDEITDVILVLRI